MLTGEIRPEGFAQNWHINTQEEHVDSALATTLREDDLAAGLARMRPQGEDYNALRGELVHYRQIVASGGWPSIPSGRQLKQGDADSPARLAALRQRLRVEGFLTDSTPPAATPTDTSSAPSPTSTHGKSTPSRRTPSDPARVYDRQLADAVGAFQEHHGINVDRMLGEETVKALNVPAEYRLGEIAANLERYRWLPRSLGNRYIIVNVPGSTRTFARSATGAFVSRSR